MSKFRFALLFLLMATPALAQSVPLAAGEGHLEERMQTKKNTWTVGVASGQLEDLYLRFAAEMQKVMNNGDDLRIMAFLADGAVANVDDLLYTKDVDVGFTQSDVLLYFKNERKIPNIANRIQYITSLYSSEFHVLATAGIKTMKDLQGKKVSFGPPGNAASLTGPIVFQRLKITVEPVFLDHTAGLEKMKTGEIDAVVRVIGKPHEYFSKVPKETGFHFLPISIDEASAKIFDDTYTLGELTSADYPNLISTNEKIDTIAVPTLLAVYNWPAGSDRYRRLERFTEYFFKRFPKFVQPGFHPKWKEVNLAANVPGWTRFSVAERMLKQVLVGRDQTSIAAQVRQVAAKNAAEQQSASGAGEDNAPAHQAGAARDKLFREFLSWRQKQQ